jgi:nicotinamidase-related amidase
MEVPPESEIVPVIRVLLDAFRAKRLPVAFTQFTYSTVPILVGELHPEHRPAPPGTPRGFGVPSSSCLEGDASARTSDALVPGPTSWSSASAGTTASPGPSWTAPCAPAA